MRLASELGLLAGHSRSTPSVLGFHPPDPRVVLGHLPSGAPAAHAPKPRAGPAPVNRRGRRRVLYCV
eukprot:9905345-Alexandrium_andersonii.AAC.1